MAKKTAVRKQEDPLRYYQAFNRRGELVALTDLTRKELQVELAKAYDLIAKVQNAREAIQDLGALFDEVERAMDAP